MNREAPAVVDGRVRAAEETALESPDRSMVKMCEGVGMK